MGKGQQYYVNTSSKFDIFVTLPLFMAINNHKQITFSFSICSDVRSECRPSVLDSNRDLFLYLKISLKCSKMKVNLYEPGNNCSV